MDTDPDIIIDQEDEHTKNDSIKKFSGWEYAVFLMLLILPLLGFVAGLRFAELNQPQTIEVTTPQTEEVSTSTYSSVSEATNTTPQFPAGYDGVLIEGEAEGVSPQDYKYNDSQIAQMNKARFWARPYFIYDGSVYYHRTNVNATTSTELLGVDGDTFGLLSEGVNGYVEYDYGFDEQGMICDDRRADHIDRESFALLPEPHSNGQRFGNYAKDKNFVFYQCRIIAGADPDTFVQLAGYENHYTKDQRGVYLGSELIANADPNSFTHLQDLYAFDDKEVFQATTTVGSLVEQIPADFSGEVTLKQLQAERGSAALLLMHKNGQVDLLRDTQVDVSWTYGERFMLAWQNSLLFVGPNQKLWKKEIGEEGVQKIGLLLTEPAREKEQLGLVDMLIHDGTLYLLKGQNCNGYLNTCELGLYSYTLTNSTESGTERLLATGVSSRRILGIDEELNQLYLGYFDGDAGCSWSSYESYSFTAGTLKDIGSFSSCEGDEELPPEEIQTLRGRLSLLSGKVPASSFTLEDGLVVTPED